MSLINTDDIDTSRERITPGKRVVCRLNGPFDGKRGRVQSTWGDYAEVELRSCTIVEPKTAFELIT